MHRSAAALACAVALAGSLGGGGVAASTLGRQGAVVATPSTRAPRTGSTCPMPRAGAQFYAPDVPGHAKTVALTFDDGPGPSTQPIIRILRSFDVRATFFNVGENEAARPGLVREEANDGFLVGSHSWSHPVMTGLSAAGQAAQLDEVTDEQRALVGSWPCAFRPPYGDYDDATLSLARARHMAVWLWSVDTEDWKAQGSGSTYWINRIVSLAETEGGALAHPVVLMHNQSIPMPATVAALPRVIEYFEAHGYTFVDLLGRTGAPGTCGARAGGFGQAPGTVLGSGRTLASNAAMVSPGGQYRLAMRGDGNLVLQAMGGRPLWASDTQGNPGASLTMRHDGDLVVSSPSGAVLWQSRTGGHKGAALSLRTDGDLAVTSSTGEWWTSSTTQSTLTPGERLEPGWYLESPDESCRLLMQRDGDLTLFTAAREVLWSSGTNDAPRALAVLEADGAFEIVSPGGKDDFSLGTEGNPGAILTLAVPSQVVVRRAGRTLWSSG